jgi:hypothetical protein
MIVHKAGKVPWLPAPFEHEDERDGRSQKSPKRSGIPLNQTAFLSGLCVRITGEDARFTLPLREAFSFA